MDRGINNVCLAGIFAFLALFGVSCTTAKIHSDEFGKKSPNEIRVMIAGSSAMNEGIYYFRKGTTLQKALLLSENSEKNRFADTLVYRHWNGESYEKMVYHSYKKSGAPEREKIVLNDLDKIEFPCTAP